MIEAYIMSSKRVWLGPLFSDALFDSILRTFCAKPFEQVIVMPDGVLIDLSYALYPLGQTRPRKTAIFQK